MNNKNILLALLGASAILTSCRKEDLDLPEQQAPKIAQQEFANATPNTLPNVIRVRFSRTEGERLEKLLREDGSRSLEMTRSMPLLEEIKAKRLERVFPYAGKYEERTRRAGLHLWYDITLEEGASATETLALRDKAMETVNKSNWITSSELVYLAQLPQVKAVRVDLRKFDATRATRVLPMNDPGLERQWHYSNTGELLRSKAGADINLFEAWKKETGKPNVVVCIVDGGVDYSHEDLRDNMHVNQAELNGVAGKDDDGNGFIDDVYGFNFYTRKGQINPHDHGSHVGGTVAARNNNGIGVCGVAGGDGSSNSGIRLISAQVFDTDPRTGKDVVGNLAAGIKYGADNGAVISQNSWGTPGVTRLSPSFKDAIDYFIKNAGCDEHGNQRPDSPMKGGVVIFAAGNEGTDYRATPASYAPVVSVSSMGPNFEVAPYSNRGDWVTIMAPGGDIYQHNGQVMSTLPNNEYGYMQGTSMACPHVSGIAALIVSKFGRQGFTNDELKKRLTTAIRPVDINVMNPEYAGRLGVGYIDADATLVDQISTIAPEAVKWDKIVATHTGLNLSWAVSSDPDDAKAFGYKLYASDKSFSKANIDKMTAVNVTNTSAKVGEFIHKTITGLEPEKQYYFALVAYDRWGNESEPTFKEATTLSNHSPVITAPKYDPIRLSGKDTYDLELTVSDADKHAWKHELVGPSHGLVVTREGDKLKVHFRVLAEPGSYKVTIKVTDELGASSQLEIPFVIYHNVAPQQTKEFVKSFLPIGRGILNYKLKEYFSDADGDMLQYAVRTVGSSTVEATIDDEGMLIIKGQKLGLSVIEVSATDPKGKSAKAMIKVEVVKDEIVHLVYPTPVTTTLNIRLADRLRSATLRVFTPTGAEVLTHEVTLPQGNQIAQLDVRSLSTGTYILHAEAEGKTFRQSFIKR